MAATRSKPGVSITILSVARPIRPRPLIATLAICYLANDDWIILACSRCATKAGRTLTSNAFNSAFFALGIRVLSIASITAWWDVTSLST